MPGTSFENRRATATQWAQANPVLKDGEFGWEKDTGVVKLGDGINAWNVLKPILGSTYLPVLGKAADSDKLDGRDSTEFLLTSDAASTYLAKTDAANTYLRADAPTAGNTANAVVKRDVNNAFAVNRVTGLVTPASSSDAIPKSYFDGYVLPTGASRTLINHYGNVTSFPTSGIKLGDRCFRTDLFCEFYYNGSAWRQSSDAASTQAQRLALPSNTGLYLGFMLRETDTGEGYRWDGVVWRPQGRVPKYATGTANFTGGKGVAFNQLERVVSVIADISYNGSTTFNIAAWGGFPVATGLPVPDSRYTNIALGAVMSNNVETTGYAAYVDVNGQLCIQSRWSARSFGSATWFDTSFSYIAA